MFWVPIFQIGYDIVMPCEFLAGFQKIETHSTTHGDCHMSTFGLGRDIWQMRKKNVKIFPWMRKDFLDRIVVPKEHIEIDWNNSCLKHERPQKLKGRTQRSILGGSIKHDAPKQFVEPVTLKMARIPKKIQISYSWKSKNPKKVWILWKWIIKSY